MICAVEWKCTRSGQVVNDASPGALSLPIKPLYEPMEARTFEEICETLASDGELEKAAY